MTAVVSFYSPKGGVGKSSLLQQVAGALTARGRSVLVIDQDGQRSSLHLANQAQSVGKPLRFAVGDRMPDDEPAEEFVLIDHSPRVTQVDRPSEAVDLIVLPLRPSTPDLDSLDQVLNILEGSYSGRVLPVWNQVERDDRDAQEYLTSTQDVRFGLAFAEWPRVRASKAIRAASNRSRTIYEADFALSTTAARRDIDALTDAILTRLGLPALAPSTASIEAPTGAAA